MTGRRPQRARPGRRRPGAAHLPVRARRSPGASPVDPPAVLYGWHTVKAALANPRRRVLQLWTTENALRRLAEENVALPVTPRIVRPEAIDARLGPDAVHQGLLAEVEPLPAPDVADLQPPGVILVLDQITDPHNVGAILRSAAAFAAKAVVTTARHSPEATGVLAKAASGALECVPLVSVRNLARGMETLRTRGFQLVGLDGSGEVDLAAATLRPALALVLGAEGKGLRQLTKATCDFLARIELPGPIKSLNVSNAAALSLFVASRRLASHLPD